MKPFLYYSNIALLVLNVFVWVFYTKVTWIGIAFLIAVVVAIRLNDWEEDYYKSPTAMKRHARSRHA